MARRDRRPGRLRRQRPPAPSPRRPRGFARLPRQRRAALCRAGRRLGAAAHRGTGARCRCVGGHGFWLPRCAAAPSAGPTCARSRRRNPNNPGDHWDGAMRARLSAELARPVTEPWSNGRSRPRPELERYQRKVQPTRHRARSKTPKPRRPLAPSARCSCTPRSCSNQGPGARLQLLRGLSVSVEERVCMSVDAIDLLQGQAATCSICQFCRRRARQAQAWRTPTTGRRSGHRRCSARTWVRTIKTTIGVTLRRHASARNGSSAR